MNQSQLTRRLRSGYWVVCEWGIVTSWGSCDDLERREEEGKFQSRVEKVACLYVYGLLWWQSTTLISWEWDGMGWDQTGNRKRISSRVSLFLWLLRQFGFWRMKILALAGFAGLLWVDATQLALALALATLLGSSCSNSKLPSVVCDLVTSVV